MNLYFRLVLLYFLSWFKPRVSFIDLVSSNKWVLLNDIDIFNHMNNGRYFTIADLARAEILVRSGMWQQLKKRKMVPIMAGETVQFRKPLPTFARYQVNTRTIGWDDKFFYVEHEFTSKKGVHALMIIKVRVIAKNSDDRMKPIDIIKLVDDRELPEEKMDQVIRHWNESSHEHWQQVEG